MPALVALVAIASAEKHGQKGGPLWYRRERRQGEPEAGLAAAVASPDHEVFAGTLDDTVVGYGLVRVEHLADGSTLGVVEDIFVDPGARAVGIGEALMNHMLSWCRARGCFGVDSLALPGDRHTKNFFESFGLVARAIIVHKPLV